MAESRAPRVFVRRGEPSSSTRCALILIHGRDETAAGFVSAFDVIFQSSQYPIEDTVIVAPEAPNDLSWWPASNANSDENEPHLLETLRMLAREIAALERAGVRRDRIVLVGFSQGAILLNTFALSLAASPYRPSMPLGGIVALAGDDFPRIPNAKNWIGEAAQEGDGPVTHSQQIICGTKDRFFTPEVIRTAADRLTAALGHAAVQLELLDGVGHHLNVWMLGRVAAVCRRVSAAE